MIRLKVTAALSAKLIGDAISRHPDVVIGGDDPYMYRWYVIPKNRFINVYTHMFLRSDDDRAHHDHPWINMSWLLLGSYLEHRIAAGGIEVITRKNAGDITLRLSGKIAHRIELINNSVCWTLFVTGPKYREWGFHCIKAGWIHWKLFTADDDPGAIGKGCDQ